MPVQLIIPLGFKYDYVLFLVIRIASQIPCNLHELALPFELHHKTYVSACVYIAICQPVLRKSFRVILCVSVHIFQQEFRKLNILTRMTCYTSV